MPISQKSRPLVLNCLNDKDELIYIFSTLIAATLALAANGKAGVAHTLRGPWKPALASVGH